MRNAFTALPLIAGILLTAACSNNHSGPYVPGHLVYVKPNTNQSGNLYNAGLDGSNERQIVPGFAGTADPYFSTGGKLVFSGAKTTSDNPTIFIANADGSNVTALTTNSPGGDEYPKISADGSLIVFDRIIGPNSFVSEIFCVDNSGNNLKQITNIRGVSYSPVWSSDKSTVFFTSNGGSQRSFNIYRIHPDGSGLMQITTYVDNGNHAYQAENPVLSPDGSTILYALTDGADSSSILYTVPVAAGTPVVVSNSISGDATYPVFSADGSQIYFSLAPHGAVDSHIFRINSNGTGLTQVTHGVLEAEPAVY